LEVDWRDDLERWLTPFPSALGHKTRRRMCPAYIAGLIGPGDRKSIQPMAAKAQDIGYDRLHHFIAAGVSASPGRHPSAAHTATRTFTPH
jgi:SRSO17 transposase